MNRLWVGLGSVPVLIAIGAFFWQLPVPQQLPPLTRVLLPLHDRAVLSIVALPIAISAFVGLPAADLFLGNSVETEDVLHAVVLSLVAGGTQLLLVRDRRD